MYQAGNVSESWAIRLECCKSQRNVSANAEIYADYIDNGTHITKCCSKLNNNASLILLIGNELAFYGHPLNEADVQQIDEALTDIRQSFLD